MILGLRNCFLSNVKPKLMKKTVSTADESLDGIYSIGTSDYLPKGLPFLNDQRGSCVALPDHFVRCVIDSVEGNGSDFWIDPLRLGALRRYGAVVELM